MEFGTPVTIAMTKWGDRPHWTYPLRFLGTDRHGTWLGVPSGTVMTRPGASVTAATDQVTLVPPDDLPTDQRAWVATFHLPGGPIWEQLGSALEVYVDITTPPVAEETTYRAVDLDLDVVRGFSDVVAVLDEDEFAEHRVSLGYPPETVRLAEQSCADVATAVRAGSGPFDRRTAQTWLDRVPDLRPTA